jgi:hypothetical protein
MSIGRCTVSNTSRGFTRERITRMYVRTGVIGWCLPAVLAAGCARTTVTFQEPEGTIMEVNFARHVWPAKVAFFRPANPGGKHVFPLRMTIPTTQGEIAVTGEMQVLQYDERDVDRYAVNACSIDPEKLKKLQEGFAVIITGFSASEQKIYQLLLGKGGP